MNLQPVSPNRWNPDVRVYCNGCAKGVSAPEAMADLDARPGTFYCPVCAALAQTDARIRKANAERDAFERDALNFNPEE